MREMKDSGIEYVGEIPESWVMHPVYYYFGERKNRNSSGKEQNLLSLSYGNVVRKDINTSEGLLPASFNTYNIVEKGDIILRPTDLQNDKRSLRTGLVTERGIITSAYLDLMPIREINTAYFHYLLHAFDITKVFYNMGNGVRQGLNFSEFSRLMVFEPSREEQDYIATYLDAKCSEIDALTADIQSQIDTLEQYKRSVITEAVTKGLDKDAEMKESHNIWVPSYPANWKLIKAGYLFEEDVRPALCTDDALSLSQKDGLIKTVDMQEHSMKSKTFDNWKHVEHGDLVLNRFKAHLGVFFASKYSGMVSFHYGVFKPKVSLNIKFYEYLFHSKPYCDMFAELSNGITVGLQNLSNSNFYAAKCVYPPIEVQNQLVTFLNEKIQKIDSIIACKQNQLDILEEYKKSLIYEYVTGKKEVPAV